MFWETLFLYKLNLSKSNIFKLFDKFLFLSVFKCSMFEISFILFDKLFVDNPLLEVE